MTAGSIWLVGLSGSGKSTVGPLLATRLGYAFIDLDARVESLAGEPVDAIFRRGGEAAFRLWEARATREVQSEDGVVVATGGGWMARDDLERTRPGRLRVWLRVAPETAIHRLASGTSGVRPLLDGDAPLERLSGLLDRRAARYAEAELTIDTDGLAPPEVADLIVEHVRGAPGTGPTPESNPETAGRASAPERGSGET